MRRTDPLAQPYSGRTGKLQCDPDAPGLPNQVIGAAPAQRLVNTAVRPRAKSTDAASRRGRPHPRRLGRRPGQDWGSSRGWHHLPAGFPARRPKRAVSGRSITEDVPRFRAAGSGPAFRHGGQIAVGGMLEIGDREKHSPQFWRKLPSGVPRPLHGLNGMASFPPIATVFKPIADRPRPTHFGSSEGRLSRRIC